MPAFLGSRSRRNRAGSQSNGAQATSNGSSNGMLRPMMSAPVVSRRRSSAHSPMIRPQAATAASATPAASTATPSPQPPPAVQIRFRLESPPLVMYGTREESTGALLTGFEDMDISGKDAITIGSATLAIIQEIKYKLPSGHPNLPHESKHMETLASWKLLNHPTNFTRGTHGYPFSHLLPGSLPPTCNSALFSVRYYIHAIVDPVDHSLGGPFEAVMDLPIKRSVPHITEKTSVRIFPPTELSLSLELPSALFPRSSIPAEVRLEGLSSPPDDSGRLRRWRPKRLNWRLIQEVTYTPPPPAPAEGAAAPEPTKVSDKQTLGEGTYKSGWKVDYSHKGLCQFETSDLGPGALANALPSLNDPVRGISIAHSLVVEVLIAEEIVITASAKQGALTGSARVLRMQFGVSVVDRPGLGISWDDEVPPVYADVPLSPPTYDTVGGQPSLEEISHMTFSPAFSPAFGPEGMVAPSPTLRHIDANIMGPEPRLSSTTWRSTLSPMLRSVRTADGHAANGLRPIQSAPQR